jgi:hypothetical protein
MTRSAWLWAVCLIATAGAGCVERRYVVTSDPPGALVFRNGVPLGPTPVDDFYVYYGTYDLTLVKDGYETLHARVKIDAPWYEYPGIDFFSENLFPYTIRDIREGGQFHFTMQPQQAVRPDDVLRRATDLRARGQTLGPAPDGTTPAPAPAAPLVPPGAPVAPIQGTVVPPPSAPPPPSLSPPVFPGGR